MVRVHDSAAAREALLAAMEGKEHGLVIVDDGLMAGLDEKTRLAVAARNLPLVVPVPGRLLWRDAEALPDDDTVARLIRRAVGYQLNIQL